MDLGPGLTTLLLFGLAVWAAALLMAIPNLAMSCQSSRHAFGNIVFFVTYLVLGLSLYDGAIFSVNIGIGVVIIFLVPLMAIGHFIYLLRGWRRERKAKRAAETPIQPEPPEGETRAAE